MTTTEMTLWWVSSPKLLFPDLWFIWDSTCTTIGSRSYGCTSFVWLILCPINLCSSIISLCNNHFFPGLSIDFIVSFSLVGFIYQCQHRLWLHLHFAPLSDLCSGFQLCHVRPGEWAPGTPSVHRVHICNTKHKKRKRGIKCFMFNSQFLHSGCICFNISSSLPVLDERLYQFWSQAGQAVTVPPWVTKTLTLLWHLLTLLHLWEMEV